MEEITKGKVYGNGEESVFEASMPSLGTPPSQHILVFNNLEAVQIL